MKLRDITKNLENFKENEINVIVNRRHYKMSRRFNYETPSLFLGQAFGAGKEYNEIIAQSMNDARDYFQKDIPVYTQLEIAESQTINNAKVFGIAYDYGEKAGIKSKINSFTLIKDMKEEINQEGLDSTKILYFAHPGHIFRVIEIGKKQGLEGGVFIPEKVIWPENDLQSWVRNPKVWKKREILARTHHWITGKFKREL